MPDSTPTPQADEPANGQLERFEVVLEPPVREPAALTVEELAEESAAHTARVSALDLDRLPDRENVRLLVDAEQLDRLRAAGLQVSVRRSVPVRPLDPALIATEDDVAGWLAARLGGASSRAADPGAAPTDEER